MMNAKYRLCLATLVSTLLGLSVATVAAHGDDQEAAAKSGTSYTPTSTGTRKLVAGPVWIKMLAEASNLGRDDVEVAELFLPPEFGEGSARQHGSLEIFYVLEGVLGHEVNGITHRLEPGMLGFVQPGDAIRHSVLSDVAVRAVVIWVPGGEAQRLIEHAGFNVEALE